MIYFISGHRDITKEEFEKFYINKINYIMDLDPFPSFVVGDYEGADIMAQEYLRTLIDQGRISEYNIYVYHMFEKPRHYAFTEYPNVKCVGGFRGDIERDSAMTKDSDFDIAFVRDGKWNSGTAQNIQRRAKLG